jgi:hypothetical protein
MILWRWEIRQDGETYRAEQWKGGQDGMGRAINEATGQVLTGSLENLRKEPARRGCQPDTAMRKPPGVIEIWW